MIKRCLAFVLTALFLTGCSPSFGSPYDININQVENIELYYPTLTNDVERKVIDEPQDIKILVDGFNAIEIQKEDSGPSPVGGFGTYCKVNYVDGSSQVIHMADELLMYSDARYIMKEEIFESESLWNSMDYDVEILSEADMPESDKSPIRN